MESSPAVLIYDAECPVCRSAVGWVRVNAPAADTFEFLPCGSEGATARFPGIDKAACLGAVHLVLPGDAVLAGEKALPEILRRLPRYRFLAALFRLPGARRLSRLFYRRFATHRYRISAVASRSGK